MINAAHDTTGGKKRIEVHCWSVAFKTAKGLVYQQHTNTPTGSLTTFDNYWPTRLSSTTGAENSDGAFPHRYAQILGNPFGKLHIGIAGEYFDIPSVQIQDTIPLYM